MSVDYLANHAMGLMGGSVVGALLLPVHRVAATLYLHGPALTVGSLHLGFWQGQDPVDVCRAMTGVGSQLWYENPSSCAKVVAERFFGIYYLTYVVVAAWAAFHALSHAVARMVRPATVTLSLGSGEWAALERAASARAAQSPLGGQ
jgi:hypothetical protein